jgi:hypothetical protein
MKYVLQWPNGVSYDYSEEQIRKEFKAGKLREDCKVRKDGTREWITLRQLLEGLGDLASVSAEEAAATAARGGTAVAQNAAARYRDAYLVARSVNGIGAFIKVLGLIVAAGCIVAGVGLGAEGRNDLLLYGGIALGLVAGIPIFVLGVLVSAAGQQTKACMDSAVHTSPFLSDAEKASVMSLN